MYSPYSLYESGNGLFGKSSSVQAQAGGRKRRDAGLPSCETICENMQIGMNGMEDFQSRDPSITSILKKNCVDACNKNP